MVLESVLSAKWVEKDYIQDLFFAFLIGCVALIMSQSFFAENASIMAIALISVAIVPLLTRVLSIEERKASKMSADDEETKFLLEHEPAIKFLLVYFVAITFVFSMFYIVFPSSNHGVFSIQFGEIEKFQSFEKYELVQTFAVSAAVLISTFLVSFVFAGGIAFIMTWNASVAGVLLGIMVMQSGSYPIETFLLFLPELVAYHFAGIAGGIMSASVTKHGLRSRYFRLVMKDVGKLMAVSVVCLFSALVLQYFVM